MTTDVCANQPEVLFFFGAGASRDFGIPTMAEFEGKIADLVNAADKRGIQNGLVGRPVHTDDFQSESDGLLRQALELIRNTQFPPLQRLNRGNVEHLFCFLQMEYELGKPGSKERLEVLLKAIAITFQSSHTMKWNPPAPRVAGDKGYSMLPSILWELYGTRWKNTGNPGFSFVTTNYDLAIEDAWNNELQYGDMHAIKERMRDDAWCWLYPGVGDVELTAIRGQLEHGEVSLSLELARYGLLAEASERLQAYPLLLKVHGSINWGICPSCDDVHVFRTGIFDRRLRAPCVLRLLSESPCKRHPETQGVSNEDISDEFRYRPLLVPPTWSKSGHCADLRKVWRKAALEIGNARPGVYRLLHAGYRCPS